MSMGRALFSGKIHGKTHYFSICYPFANLAQNRSTDFDDGDHLRLTHCGGKNMKIDDIMIFRRFRHQNTGNDAKTGFSCLKSDLHQMLGLKATLREEEVISISGVA